MAEVVDGRTALGGSLSPFATVGANDRSVRAPAGHVALITAGPGGRWSLCERLRSASM